MAGLALWLLAEACGQGIQKITVCTPVLWLRSGCGAGWPKPRAPGVGGSFPRARLALEVGSRPQAGLCGCSGGSWNARQFCRKQWLGTGPSCTEGRVQGTLDLTRLWVLDRESSPAGRRVVKDPPTTTLSYQPPGLVMYFWKRRKFIADPLSPRGRGRTVFNPLSLASHPSRPTLGPDLMPDGGPLRQTAENRSWELVHVLNWSEGGWAPGRPVLPLNMQGSACSLAACAPESRGHRAGSADL